MIRITALFTALLLAAPAMATDAASDQAAIHHSVARADLFSCSKPVWPAAAKAAGHQGTVTLMFDIDADGKIVRSKVEKSSAHSDLDEAALEGISKCAFFPGMANGKPVRSVMQMRYVWTLK